MTKTCIQVYDEAVGFELSMIKPIGGRGRKAPYDTVMVRVPFPIKTEVEDLVAAYRRKILSGDEGRYISESEDKSSEDFLIALKLVDRFIKEIQQTEHLHDSTRRNNRNLARLRDWLIEHIQKE